MPIRSLALGLVVLAGALSSQLGQAKDFFLTIGGGGSPTGNQVSLEKNVLYFQRVREVLGIADTSHDILFSDGNDPGRDLQYHDPDAAMPESNLLVAQLCSREDGLWDNYRTHQVPGIRGPSSRGEIERWFDERVEEIQPGDRVFIYFTGHGGKGSGPNGNHMHLWNGEKLTVKDFVKLLDRLPDETAVTCVMVQCYSGGFSNLIFEDGDPDRGASAANRCGFFATTHDRVAAGCTSDIDEENYQEYSSFFWAALAGEKRLGDSIARPDYDADGRTSFEEAHAFTLLESNTIDVSVRTSDALLRSLSKLEGNGLLAATAPREEILAAATPADRAVLEGLEKELELGDRWLAGAKEELEESKKRKASTDRQKGRKASEHKRLAGEILSALKQRWPELENPWHPRVQEILATESAALLRVVQSHRKYSEMAAVQAELSKLDDASLAERRRAAKCQRFIDAIDRVALAANLEKLATPENVERYRKLLAAESQGLDRPTASVSVRAPQPVAALSAE